MTNVKTLHQAKIMIHKGHFVMFEFINKVGDKIDDEFTGNDIVHLRYNGSFNGSASFSFRADKTMREGSFGAKAEEVAEFENYEFYLEKFGIDKNDKDNNEDTATIWPTPSGVPEEEG